MLGFHIFLIQVSLTLKLLHVLSLGYRMFLSCFLFPPLIKLSIFSTLLGDLNTLNSLCLTMDLFSRTWTIFCGFFWVLFFFFNRFLKKETSALLILQTQVIVFLSYTWRTGFIFMLFWMFMSILFQDPLNSPASTYFQYVISSIRKV